MNVRNRSLQPKTTSLLRATCLSLLCVATVAGCAAATAPAGTAASRALACDKLVGAQVSPITTNNSDVSELSVDDLPGPVEDWEPDTARVAGISIAVEAEPGMSRALLERRVLCYRRTNRASTSDPLLIDGATLRVTETHGHFQIRVTSREPAVAARILNAAQSLENRTTVATTR